MLDIFIFLNVSCSPFTASQDSSRTHHNIQQSKHCVSAFLLTTNFQPVGAGAGDKRSPISRLLTAGSDATLNDQEENLSAYFEPFGSALVPCAPGNRDSIASNESDSLLPSDKKENNDNEVFGLD